MLNSLPISRIKNYLPLAGVFVFAVAALATTGFIVSNRQTITQQASEGDGITITGKVYYDKNENGKFDEGDQGLSGTDATVKLAQGGSINLEATPDENGNYKFENLPTGGSEYQPILFRNPSSSYLLPTTTDFYIPTKNPSLYENIDFGVTKTGPHDGPKNTCTIKPIIQTVHTELKRGNIALPVILRNNPSVPQNSNFWVKGIRTPTSDWYELIKDNSLPGTTATIVASYFSSGGNQTATGQIECRIVEPINRTTLYSQKIPLTVKPENNIYQFTFGTAVDSPIPSITQAQTQVQNTPIPTFKPTSQPLTQQGVLSPTQSPSTCNRADFNCDGVIDEIDLNIFLKEYDNAKK